MLVKSLRFEEDDRFGQQYEYNEQGQPIRFMFGYIARALVTHGPSVKLDFYLSSEDSDKIRLIVEAAAQRELDSAMHKA